MAGEHERWIIDLFEGLPSKSKQRLAGLLNDLKNHVRRASGWPRRAPYETGKLPADEFPVANRGPGRVITLNRRIAKTH